ncbi:hypothetical protein LTR85_001515 [Meristemomyces frigidus]|nr:hypothetical protein LTR85_001515 [Meristemomyces frigidus]
MATLKDTIPMEHPPQPSPQHFMATSGATDPVWVHTEPYSNRPTFSKLDRDLDAYVCVVGSGIAGVQTAYELVHRGHKVVMLEARDVLAGETGRTSGHLASALDDGYVNIAAKHGDKGAVIAAESHTWALNHVGEVAKKLGIECEYRKLPGYEVSQYDKNKQPKEHASEVKELKEEVAKCKSIGMDVEFKEGFKVQGWDGEPDQRDAAIFQNQATYHPTKYVVGVLKWLKEQPNFECYTHTRVIDTPEKGIEIGPIGHKHVEVKTMDGHTVRCNDVVMATCVPLHKLSVVGEMEYDRTYCIAIKVPKGYVEDCLLYDQAEEYKYVRMTACDAEHDYMVVGGCDHKVGQEEPVGRSQELEQWTRERFTKAGSVDYAWSGQVFEPVDYMAYIGRDPGTKHTWIITGDSGNGLTHFVLASPIIADEIEGKSNKWSELYKPNRVTSIVKSAKDMLSHDLQINAQYKRFLKSDIHDIEDLPNGEGGVLNPTLKAPIAVYKDDEGGVHKFSAVCPHLKGVICWNRTEKSWDCPVHGSRFSKDGVCVMGPAKGGLNPADESGAHSQHEALKV